MSDQYRTMNDYGKALESMFNLLGSKYISNLMLDASLEERTKLAKRITGVVITVHGGTDGDDPYVVVATDDVEDNFDTEPLWSHNKQGLIDDCKRWYGATCIINFMGE